MPVQLFFCHVRRRRDTCTPCDYGSLSKNRLSVAVAATIAHAVVGCKQVGGVPFAEKGFAEVMNTTNARIHPGHIGKIRRAVRLVDVTTAVQGEQVVEEDGSVSAHDGCEGRVDGGAFKQRAALVEDPFIQKHSSSLAGSKVFKRSVVPFCVDVWRVLDKHGDDVGTSKGEPNRAENKR